MKMHFITILFFIGISNGFGQSLDEFLNAVEQNNPKLAAMQKWLEAEEVRAKTAIYPENPEVRFNYLWGNAHVAGNQQELEITQSFKLPGYYMAKANVQKLDYAQSVIVVEKEKQEILHQARTSWFRLVRLKKQAILLTVRRNDVAKLTMLMEEGFKTGEVSKPAFDKARIYALSIQSAWQKNQYETELQLQTLSRLSGISFGGQEVLEYPADWEFPDRDSLLAALTEKNPALTAARLAVEQSDVVLKQRRMSSFPTFEAGYKSESVLKQKLRGFHAGISIPLWQQTNDVKQARLQSMWTQAQLLQLHSELQSQALALFAEAAMTRTTYEQMRQILQDESVTEGGLELLRSGQVSFAEYLVDQELVWEAQIEMLQQEFQYYELLSKLKMFR